MRNSWWRGEGGVGIPNTKDVASAGDKFLGIAAVNINE